MGKQKKSTTHKGDAPKKPKSKQTPERRERHSFFELLHSFGGKVNRKFWAEDPR